MTLNEFLAKAGDLFKANGGTEIGKQLATTQAELATATASISTLTASLAERDSQLQAANQSLADAKKQAQDKDAEFAKLQADHKTALEAKEKEVATRAAAQAQEIVAKLGHSPVTVKPNSNPATTAADPKNYTQKCLAAKGKG